MKKGDIINGYTILEDFKVAGGTSKVSFAEKGGITYFIKEFLYPKYPTSDSPGSERTKEKKRQACDEFEKHHRDLNNAIGKCCVGTGGNLIYAIDFFRNGTSYYKVTEKIDISSFPCEDIASLPLGEILLIAKSAVHSIRILHNLHIVHGDLKPDNLPIKEAMKGYVVKLIDFDDSYFERNPPSDRESLVGTPEYYSPEQAAYIMDEDEDISGETLTCKSDIFTLGIIFSEYFSGAKPVLSGKHVSTWTCVRDGDSFLFKKPLPEKIEKLIRVMLSLNSDDRPSINDVFKVLHEVKSLDTTESRPEVTGIRIGRGIIITKKHEPRKPLSGSTTYSPKDEKATSGLRGKGLNIAKK